MIFINKYSNGLGRSNDSGLILSSGNHDGIYEPVTSHSLHQQCVARSGKRRTAPVTLWTAFSTNSVTTDPVDHRYWCLSDTLTMVTMPNWTTGRMARTFRLIHNRCHQHLTTEPCFPAGNASFNQCLPSVAGVAKCWNIHFTDTGTWNTVRTESM